MMAQLHYGAHRGLSIALPSTTVVDIIYTSRRASAMLAGDASGCLALTPSVAPPEAVGLGYTPPDEGLRAIDFAEGIPM